MNVLNVFDKNPGRERSHSHRHYTSSNLHDVSIDGLLPFIQKPLRLHHIRTKLYSIPFTLLHSLYKTSLDSRKCIKQKQEDIDSLSEWLCREVLNFETNESLRRSMSAMATSVFKDSDVEKTLSTILDKYVVVPAGKAKSTIVFVCKKF